MASVNSDGLLKPTIVDGALNLEGLCLVHSTLYLPEINADGSVDINSTYIATGGQKPRNTVHFALNHKVSSHSFGSWEDTPYAVIAPFQDMIKTNGAPPTITTVDTFWPTNARDPLHVPNAVVVMPSEETDALFSRNGNIATYKTKNYTAEDEAILCAESDNEFSVGFSYKKISGITDLKKRELALRELAHKYAINQTIQSCGFEVEEADAYLWYNENYMTQMLETLALEIGSKNCRQHSSTDYQSLARTMHSAIEFANFLEANAGIDGKVLVGDSDHIYMYDKDHTLIGNGDPRRFDRKARLYKEDGNEKSLICVRDDLVKVSKDLDPKTREMVRDFSDKISARIAKGLDAFDFQATPKPVEPKVVASPSPTDSPRFSQSGMSG